MLGDVGIHILDFTCFVAGSLPRDISCRLKTFHKADGDQIGEYPLDANDNCAMDLELENGAVGVVSATRFASGHHNDLRLRIYGDLGGVEAAYEKATGRVRLCSGADLETETWRDVETPDVRSTYQRFIEAIVGKSGGVPDFKTAADLQKALDGAEQSDRQDGRRVTLV